MMRPVWTAATAWVLLSAASGAVPPPRVLGHRERVKRSVHERHAREAEAIHRRAAEGDVGAIEAEEVAAQMHKKEARGTGKLKPQEDLGSLQNELEAIHRAKE